MRYGKTLTAILAFFILALVAGPVAAMASPTPLFSFDGADGSTPQGNLTLSGSTLYGMTSYGGSNYTSGGTGSGVIFSIPTSGGLPTILFNFDGAHGENPIGSLTLSGSTLYGMAQAGGAYGNGSIFSISTSGGTPKILYSFTGSDGANPNGSLTFSGSTLYGMTAFGGSGYTGPETGSGTIFSIPTIGGTPTILYSFSGATNGAYPLGSLTLSGQTLYGMAGQKGTHNAGTIFSISTSGGTPKVLFAFDGAHGKNPEGDLTLCGSTLYGMTNLGGTNSMGVIFSLPITGGTPKILYSFSGTTDGGGPYGNLTLSGSTLYGMTSVGGENGYGTIFSIPTSGGLPTVLFSFDVTNGQYPMGSLLLSGNYLYGMTEQGGANGNGLAFALQLPVVTVNQTTGGVVTVTPSLVAYSPSSEMTITASASPGYSFVSWSVTGEFLAPTLTNSTAPSTSLTVLSSCDLSATFHAITYGVSGLSGLAAGGTASVGSATGTIGQVVSLFQTTNSGYSLTGWTVNDHGHGARLNSGSASITLGSSNVTVTANYAPIQYPVTLHQSTSGTVILRPSQATYAYSQTGTLTATAIPGYSFVTWSVTGGSVASNTSSQAILTVTGTCTVAASYNKLDYSATLNDGGGTVILSNYGPYKYGQVITATALAESEYTFSGWSVTGPSLLNDSAAASTVLTVHDNFTLTASYTYTGSLTTLCSFTGIGGACPGAFPFGSLTLSGSSLYGMSLGGEENCGTIFSLPTSGGAPTILYSFSGEPDGANPYGSLTLGGSTLYGMTKQGGANNVGTIFSIPTTGGTPTILYSFIGTPDGMWPYGSLTLSGSTLYGMTNCGGANNYGTIFSLPTLGGAPTILYSFSGTSDGANPQGSLTLSGSTLYGMTNWAGTNSDGTIFSIPTSGGTPTILYSFSGTTDGANPYGSLMLSGSTLYGMTNWAGTKSAGTIFSIPTSGRTLKVLCSFDGTHGGYPDGDLTLSGSTLYGMTSEGGNMSLGGCGTVFSLPISGGTPTILFSFDDAHGTSPQGDLTLSGSTLYGMTQYGGNLNLNFGNGYGTVFRLPVTVPHQYTLAIKAGTSPTGGTVTVTPDQATYSPNALVEITASTNPGYIFESWSTVGGTAASNTSSQTLLKMTGNVTLTANYEPIHYPVTLYLSTSGAVTLRPSQATYTYSQTGTLTAAAIPGYRFVDWLVTGGSVASNASSQTVLTVSGACTVTASFHQIVYSNTLTDVGGGTIMLSSNGPYIYGQVITATAVAEPGYTFSGWVSTSSGKLGNSKVAQTTLTVNGNFTLTAEFTYTGSLTTLCSFDGSNGAYPVGSLTQSGSTLYGMTSGDGVNNYGTVFSIPTIGGTPTILYSFSGTTDGGFPVGALTLSGSTLYGMTPQYGINYDGIIFSLPTSGGSLTILYSFSGATDGANPQGSLTLSGATLYGMTNWAGTNSFGTIFSIPTNGGTPTILYSFSGATDGANPDGSLTLSGSTLYGMASGGGTNSFGTIFSIPTSGGTPTILCSFDGIHGANPYGDLTLSGSTLYGMTNWGGNMGLNGGFGDGTVFSIPTSGGTPTILFSFDGAHGENPYGDLTLSGSTLYGMTSDGGNMSLGNGFGDGTIFRLPVTVPHQYTLEVTAVTPSTGGTVTVTPVQATYSPNALVEITAQANPGFNFVSWSVTGVGTVVSKTSSQTMMTMKSNMTLSASFHEINYSDKLAHVGGTIQFTPSNQPFYLGALLTITATPTTGWQFVNWSFTPTGALLTDSTAQTTSLTVLGNFDLTANFSELTYDVSVVASPSGGGTVSVSSTTGIISQVISLNRTTNPGYSFIGWTLNDGGHGARFNSGSASITLGSSNVTVTASYTQIHYPVTVHQSTGGAVTLSPSQATYTYSQNGTLTATASTGYNFMSWSVTGGSVASKTSSNTTLNVTGSCTVTASYQLVYSDTLTDVGGTIRLTPSQGPYYYNMVVGLTASASAGWQFVSWSVTEASLTSSTAQTTSLKVLGNFDLTATFRALIYSVSGVARPAAGGLVSVGSATGTIGQVIAISQTTNANYNFISWTVSDGGHGAMFNSDSTAITFGSSNVTVTASYAPIHYPVTVHQSTSGAVTLTPSLATYTYSQSGTLTATASPGYGFVTWSVTGGSVVSSASSKTALTVTGSCTVTASYSALVYSSTTTDVGNGTIILSSSGPYTYGQVITVTASAQTGYAFDGWIVTGSSTLSNSAASTSLTVHGSFTLTAEFVQAPTILCSFTGSGGACPGEDPQGSLTLSGSTLYGMTNEGGANGYGTIFRIPISGGTPNILFNFDGPHGAYPEGSLTLSGSTLYGMTNDGGANSYGAIFSIPTIGGTPTILYSFSGGTDGGSSLGDLTLSGSTLYGITNEGGANYRGTIFSISTSGGTPTILYSFSGATDGSSPQGSLTLSGSTLYGMTEQSGANGAGTIFSLPTIGGTPTILYSFSGAATDGGLPHGSLTLSGSTLYGMTYDGGAHDLGTIFSISTSGGKPNLMFSFSTSAGGMPLGSLTLSGSTLYGTTEWSGVGYVYGTIFSIPISGGTPTILYSFTGTSGSASPDSSLALSGSTLYGMTQNGGSDNDGTVFSFTVLH